MVTRLLLLVLLALGVTATPAAACEDPVAYGAVPDDGIDDGPAIRAALAAGDTCLPSGTWDLGYVYGSGSVIVGPGKSLTGQGPATILRMSGDAHAGTWFGVRVQGGSLERLAVTQAIVNPDPSGQNHLIRVDTSTGSRLVGLALGPMTTGGGDCIQLLGNTGDVEGLLVEGVTALGCERSGIAVQHGVASATVTGVVLNARVGGEIDYEPTSPGPTRITWSGATLIHTSVARALTMSDVGGDNRSTFTGLLVLNGNVQAVRASGVSFVGNVVVGSSTATSATFEVIRDSVGLRVVGNLFIRPTTAPAGSVVRLVCNQGLCPTRATVADNTIEQGTAGWALETDGLVLSAIRGNVVTTAWTWAIRLGASARSPDLVDVSHNLLESTATPVAGTAAVYLAASAAWPMGRVLVADNLGRGFAGGVVCANAVTGPVRISDNLLGPATCPAASQGWNQ